MQIDKFQNYEGGARNAKRVRREEWKVQIWTVAHSRYGSGPRQRITKETCPYPSDNWWILDEIAWLLRWAKLRMRQKILPASKSVRGENHRSCKEWDRCPLAQLLQSMRVRF